MFYTAVAASKKITFETPDGEVMLSKTMSKLTRDVMTQVHGSDDGKVVFDPTNPLNGRLIEPGESSPFCQKCTLSDRGSSNPFIPYQGPTSNPLITLVVESVSPREDSSGVLSSGGQSQFIKSVIEELARDVGIKTEQIRWAPLTRCAALSGKKPNYKTHGNWCRHFLVQELACHPPKVIIPVGSSVLGLMSHKSSAQDWGGRILTWRGWPDDWLMDAEFALPRRDPSNDERMITGHPVMGPVPSVRIPMVPVQAPRIVYATQNPRVITRWKNHLKSALILARDGINPPDYNRPWFRITEDPDEIEQTLREIINNPGMLVCFDTETTGLKPWSEGQSVVFMMFRWADQKGRPRSIGFPWDFDSSRVKPFITRLSPTVLEALYVSKIVGHNTTFDVMFVAANVPGCDLDRLCNAARYDTWHMAYTARQQTGSLGLDLIAYDWAKDMAGYEEDMTLLISLLGDEMNPENGKGGHYANCPRDKWDTHLKTYVMGDVEVCYTASKGISEKLDGCRQYTMPLAHPVDRGRFRHFTPPSRRWVYDNVVSPASVVLMKMMGRGMHVDIDELSRQEDIFPKKITECRAKIKAVTPEVEAWCRQMEATEPEWEFDPENREHLREVLFNILKLPIQRLTESGRKLYSDETPDDIAQIPREEAVKYAALDKFSLNKLAVSHAEVRPLQEYRKVHKAYTTYVRPMRNVFNSGIDKKARERTQHLGRDGKVHTTFKLTGTRGGRLSSSDPNVQQLPRDGLVKRMYSSRFGELGCIYQGDLSQIELRLLAAACGDSSMVGAYHKGIDLHSLTHSNIYSKKYEECTNDFMGWLQSKGRDKEAKALKEERKVAKCVDPYTLVSVGGTVVRIGSIHPGREDDTFYDVEESVTVQVPGNAQVPVRKFYCNGVKDRYLVVTKSSVLVCSDVHKLVLHDGSLIMVKNLAKGMVLKDIEPLKGAGIKPKLHDIFQFLADLGRAEDAEQVHEFPEWVFNMDATSKRIVIAGIVDIFGTVSRSGTARVNFTSWKLCQDFCVLLKSAGMGCTISSAIKFQGTGALRGKKRLSLVVYILGERYIRTKDWSYRRRGTSNRPRGSIKSRNVNSIMGVYKLPPGVLVDISIDSPHIHVPNGISAHQTVNFLTGYGGGPYGLQTSLAQQGIYKELSGKGGCEEILESFFDAYPALRTYLSYYKNFIAANGVAVSVLGRVRIFEEVFSDDNEAVSKALRAGCNHLIQSTASDIMLVLLCVIESLMRDQGLQSILVLTVHDSLAIDALKSELDAVHEIVNSVLNNITEVLKLVFGDDYDASWIIVPLAGDCQVGNNYLDAREIPDGSPDWDKLLEPVESK